jgi:integrase
MAHIRTHDTTERRKNKVVKTYGVVWREPDRDQFGLSIPVNLDHPRGRSDARLAGDLLSAARHTTGTSALAEHKRRGAAVWVRRAGWLDAEAVKVSQVKLMLRTVKPPPWPRQTTDGPTGLPRCRSPGYESTRR